MLLFKTFLKNKKEFQEVLHCHPDLLCNKLCACFSQNQGGPRPGRARGRGGFFWVFHRLLLSSRRLFVAGGVRPVDDAPATSEHETRRATSGADAADRCLLD